MPARKRPEGTFGNARLRPGRPSGTTTADTRERILDVAEALFAEGGYDATSIRNVAAEANVAIAVVTYHVGPKADLFDAVIKRRAVMMGEMRSAALSDALASTAGVPVPIEVLAKAYVMPFLQFARTHDRGWQNFAILMGRLSNSPHGTDVIRRYYDDVARAYLAEMYRSLPGASPDSVVVGFLGMVSLMLFVCAGTNRLEALVGDVGSALSEQSLIEHVLNFCVSGLIGMETSAG